MGFPSQLLSGSKSHHLSNTFKFHIRHSTFEFPVSKTSLWRNLDIFNCDRPKKHPATFQRWNTHTPALTLQIKIVTAVIWQSVQHSNLHKAALWIQPDLQVSSHTLHVGAETFPKCDHLQRWLWIWQNTLPCFCSNPCGSTFSRLFFPSGCFLSPQVRYSERIYSGSIQKEYSLNNPIYSTPPAQHHS